jgi:hypothetical protein
MVGQLSLFKGQRQRGVAPPAPSEFALHCAVADTIRRFIMPDWRFTHLPLGELRDKVTAARLKRMGTTPGWPDLMFFHAQGQVCFLELKRRGGRPTDIQADLSNFLCAAGHAYQCTDSFQVAVNTLKAWGVVRSGVEVQ